MPNLKPSEKLIEKIYRRKYEDLGMFFFVEGQRSILPAVSIQKAICNYYRYMGDEDFNLESCNIIYQRMKKEYYESAKTDR